MGALLEFAVCMVLLVVLCFGLPAWHAERTAPRRPYLNDPYARAAGQRLAEEMGFEVEPSVAQVAYRAKEREVLDAAEKRAKERQAQRVKDELVGSAERAATAFRSIRTSTEVS